MSVTKVENEDGTWTVKNDLAADVTGLTQLQASLVCDMTNSERRSGAEAVRRGFRELMRLR